MLCYTQLVLTDALSMETKQLELNHRGTEAIPSSLVQGSTPAFPAGTSHWACSHMPGHATLMQLSPPKPRKLHVAIPLGVGSELDAALTV